MKPYLKQQSWRPGCSCCNIAKGLHHFRPSKLSQQDKAAKRAGKKQVRQAGRRETRQQSTSTEE